jgi:rhodanese-related sulfurtransferase
MSIPGFFVPKLAEDQASEEAVYAGLRREAEAQSGHVPGTGRIFKLLCRRGGADCETEVGQPDPVCGQTVLAILDLGRGHPYLVCCGTPGGPITQLSVTRPVYAVTEFSA